MTGSWNWPSFDFSFEKHVVEVKKDFYGEVDWDIDLRTDVELDIYKDIDVYIDSDLDLEGNSAVNVFELEDFTRNDLVSAELVQVAEIGTSSVAQGLVETDDYSITSVATAGYAQDATVIIPVVSLAEINTNVLVTGEGFHITHVGEAATDFIFSH